MSYESSMVYTIGMALNRALDSHAEVAVLVDGVWLGGTVVIHDGHGVVLDNDEEHSIVKLEEISAIRILDRLPEHARIMRAAAPGDSFAEPIPMPGPRHSTD